MILQTIWLIPYISLKRAERPARRKQSADAGVRQADKGKGRTAEKVGAEVEYKRLLKAAVEDINYYVDCYEAHCGECCCDQDNHCHWKHEAEALALIGEENTE